MVSLLISLGLIYYGVCFLAGRLLWALASLWWLVATGVARRVAVESRRLRWPRSQRPRGKEVRPAR